MGALNTDIRAISDAQLAALQPGPDVNILILGGTECRARSPAGLGLGVYDHRDPFPAVCTIITQAQSLWPGRVGYVLENVAVREDEARPGVVADEQRFRTALGRPLVYDATQVGSYAARVRAVWTNLVSASVFTDGLATFNRMPFSSRSLVDLLEPGRAPSLCATRSTPPPGFPCNTFGQPVNVLPCLVSSVGSYAFLAGRSGFIIASPGAAFTDSEPIAVERERCMGFPEHYTALPGWSEFQRRRLLGQSVDQFQFRFLFSTILNSNRSGDLPVVGHPSSTPRPSATTPAPPSPPLPPLPRSVPPPSPPGPWPPPRGPLPGSTSSSWAAIFATSSVAPAPPRRRQSLSATADLLTAFPTFVDDKDSDDDDGRAAPVCWAAPVASEPPGVPPAFTVLSSVLGPAP